MKYNKCKLIIYALVALSASGVFMMLSTDKVCSEMVLSHYLYQNRENNFSLKFFPVRNHLLSISNVNEDKRKNQSNKTELHPENSNIYLSDDKNIVFDSQKSTMLNFNNETDYTIDAQSLLAEKPNLGFGDSTQPQILIIHTHASESYGYKRTYPLTDTDRTQDTEYNMVRVGRELKKCLEEKGHTVLHDTTIHDYPSYTSSYKRAGETIQKYLDEYPSIVAVFDLHRDAVIKNDGKSTGLVSEQNGEECAQIMIVCGTDKNNLRFDTWEDNLRFAFKIQDYMEKQYPGLMRPINIRKERFNLHMTNGSLLFEMGSSGNSLIQALNSVKYLADGIDKTLQNISKSY